LAYLFASNLAEGTREASAICLNAENRDKNIGVANFTDLYGSYHSFAMANDLLSEIENGSPLKSLYGRGFQTVNDVGFNLVQGPFSIHNYDHLRPISCLPMALNSKYKSLFRLLHHGVAKVLSRSVWVASTEQ